MKTDQERICSFLFTFYCSIKKNILRHFPYLKVFISNSKLQFIKPRMLNKKFLEQQYFNICEDSKFTFHYLSLNVYKYSDNISLKINVGQRDREITIRCLSQAVTFIMLFKTTKK